MPQAPRILVRLHAVNHLLYGLFLLQVGGGASLPRSCVCCLMCSMYTFVVSATRLVLKHVHTHFLCLFLFAFFQWIHSLASPSCGQLEAAMSLMRRLTVCRPNNTPVSGP